MSGSPRTVKLWCPSVSKIVAFIVRDEQRLDLGSIARVSGLDPSTVRLNGHFISRGVDLVSSSVTWRSLLNFFSARGLSTGKDDQDALVIDGKLCKVGTKRAHNPEEEVSIIDNRAEPEGGDGVNGARQCQDTTLRAIKKLKESESGFDEGSQSNGVGSKRKDFLEAVHVPKKSKKDSERQGNDHSSIVTSRDLNCNYTRDNMKRMREEEAILEVPCKRNR